MSFEYNNPQKKAALTSKMNALIKCKDDFKYKVHRYYFNFRYDELDSIFNGMEKEVKSKYDEYINYPSNRLSEHYDDLEWTVGALNKEIEDIFKKYNEKLDDKFKSVKKNCEIEVQKIRGLLIENEAFISHISPEDKAKLGSRLADSDILKGTLIVTGVLGVGAGVTTGIVVGTSLGEIIAASTSLGVIGGGAGAVVGFFGSFAVYGIYKLGKYFQKSNDLVEIAQKAKGSFNVFKLKIELRKNIENDEKIFINKIVEIIDKEILITRKAIESIY